MKTSGVGVLITKVSATGERNIMDDPVACDAIKTLVEGGYTGDDVMKAWRGVRIVSDLRWRDIETAPKDGTPVIIGKGHDGKITGVRLGVWNGLGWYEVYSGAGINYATHWMPCPPTT